MSIKHYIVKSCGVSRHTTYDTHTGRSQRISGSAGGYVDNGKHRSSGAAREAARSDIRRGPRSPGDFSKR